MLSVCAIWRSVVCATAIAHKSVWRRDFRRSIGRLPCAKYPEHGSKYFRKYPVSRLETTWKVWDIGLGSCFRVI